MFATNFQLVATLALILFGIVFDLASAASLAGVAKDLTPATTDWTSPAVNELAPTADKSAKCVRTNENSPNHRGPFRSQEFRDAGRYCVTNQANHINVCTRVDYYEIPDEDNVYKVDLGIANYGPTNCDVSLFTYKQNAYISGPAVVNPGTGCVDVSVRLHGFNFFTYGAYLEVWCL